MSLVSIILSYITYITLSLPYLVGYLVVMISIRAMHMGLIAYTIEFATAMLYFGLIVGAEPFRLMMKNRIPENLQRVCFEGTRVGFYGEHILFGGKLLKNKDAAETAYSKLFPFAVGLLIFLS